MVMSAEKFKKETQLILKLAQRSMATWFFRGVILGVLLGILMVKVSDLT